MAKYQETPPIIKIKTNLLLIGGVFKISGEIKNRKK